MFIFLSIMTFIYKDDKIYKTKYLFIYKNTCFKSIWVYTTYNFNMEKSAFLVISSQLFDSSNKTHAYIIL